MNGLTYIPPVAYLKHKARLHRQTSLGEGKSLSHSQALEQIAHEYGYRDWNCLHAVARKHINIVTEGQPVEGSYLGQSFKGTIKRIASTADKDQTRVAISFDKAIDVVSFESFSNLRKQVSCTLNGKAMTEEKTSNGIPQLVLNL